jgi:hypothetical protein
MKFPQVDSVVVRCIYQEYTLYLTQIGRLTPPRGVSKMTILPFDALKWHCALARCRIVQRSQTVKSD